MNYLGTTSFSAADIVGNTLTAKTIVPAKLLPEDSAPIAFYIQKGSPVGVVYSFLSPRPGRSRLWWMFIDQRTKKPYYVEHVSGYFNITAIQEQGIKTTEQKAKEEAEKKKREEMGDFAYYTEKWGKTVLLGVAGTFLVGKLITAMTNEKTTP